MAVMRLPRFVRRVRVAMPSLISVFVVLACTTTSRISAVPPALDPGGGVAIFWTSGFSEGMASCVAKIVQRRLPTVRIVSGSDASALAFGPQAERSMPPPGPDPLQPVARQRLQDAGISYIVVIYGYTDTSYDSSGSTAMFRGMGMFWDRASDVIAVVYEARSGKEVTVVRAIARGRTGFGGIVIPLVPILAFTESHACRAVATDLSDAFERGKTAVE